MLALALAVLLATIAPFRDDGNRQPGRLTVSIIACASDGDSKVSASLRRLPTGPSVPITGLRPNPLGWSAALTLSAGYYEIQGSGGRACSGSLRVAVLAGVERAVALGLHSGPRSFRTAGALVVALPAAGLMAVVSDMSGDSPRLLESVGEQAVGDDLAPGTYRLSVRFSNCCEFARPVEIHRDEIARIAVDLIDYHRYAFERLLRQVPYVTDLRIAADRSKWFIESFGVEVRIGHLDVAGQLHEFILPNHGRSARGLMPRADGSVWFAEGPDGIPARITAAGLIEERDDLAGGVMSSLVEASDGAIWQLVPNHVTLRRIDSNGSVRSFDLGDDDLEARSLQRDPKNGVWFSEFRRRVIVHVGNDGSVEKFPIPWSDCMPATLVRWNARFVVGCGGAQGRLIQLDTYGTYTELASAGRFDGYSVGTVDRAGRLWTMDKSGRVVVFAGAGRYSDAGYAVGARETVRLAPLGNGVVIGDTKAGRYVMLDGVRQSELHLGVAPAAGDEWEAAATGDLWLVQSKGPVLLRITSRGVAERIRVSAKAPTFE